MSRLSADPAAMTGAARAVSATAAALDETRGAVVGALVQVSAAGGSSVGPAAADAARRWHAALADLSAVADDLGTGVARAAAGYAEVERDNTVDRGSGSW